MVRLTRGEDLAGNANRDSYYLDQRSTDILKQVGAVDAIEAEVMSRADEIGRGNQDGLTQATELRDLWEPDVRRTLLDPERLALSNMWAKYRIERHEFPLLEVEELSETSFHDLPARKGEIDRRVQIDIQDLPEELHPIATRLQWAADEHRGSAHLTYGELVDALKPDQIRNYRRAEASQIKEIETLVALDARGPIVPPRLVVPQVGEHTLIAARVASATATLRYKTELNLTRGHREARGVVARVEDRLEYARSVQGFDLDVPSGHRAILISEGGERVVEEGLSRIELQPGRHVMEIYNERGQKLGDDSFTLPEINMVVSLTRAHLGKPVLTTEGQPLHLGLVEYRSRNNRGGAVLNGQYVDSTTHQGRWTYSAKTPHQDEEQAAAARTAFAWPESTLHDGIYSVHPHRTSGLAEPETLEARLEKYPGPLYAAVIDGARFWLTPNGSLGAKGAQNENYEMRVFSSRDGQVDIIFNSDTDLLTITRQNAQRGGTSWTHHVVLEDGVLEPSRDG